MWKSWHADMGKICAHTYYKHYCYDTTALDADVYVY